MPRPYPTPGDPKPRIPRIPRLWRHRAELEDVQRPWPTPFAARQQGSEGQDILNPKGSECDWMKPWISGDRNPLVKVDITMANGPCILDLPISNGDVP